MISIEFFVLMLTILSGIAGLLTEAIKKSVGEDKIKLPYNLLDLITAAISGCGGMFVYYYMSGTVIDGKLTLLAILMAIACWLASMLGYDKIKQLIDQMKSLNK